MGTHPIFESDFDCLTDCLQFSEKRKKREISSFPLSVRYKAVTWPTDRFDNLGH